MSNDAFKLLQNWYVKHCNGDWEHEFGIRIDTLDNPGWSVVIDLVDTNLENKKFTKINQLKTEHDWIQCKVENHKFHAAGGPQNLIDIINVFIEWKNSTQPTDNTV